MTFKDYPNANVSSRPRTVDAWIRLRRPAFTEADLVEALEQHSRPSDTVRLNDFEREIWEKQSGVAATAEDIAQASASNAAATVLLASTSLTAAEVAEMLAVSASTIRRYRAERKLNSYTVQGRALFPAWQFVNGRPLPHLDSVLKALPRDLHPQTVAGFFKAPQPELTLGGRTVTVSEWLLSGGSPEPVVKLASGLGTAI